MRKIQGFRGNGRDAIDAGRLRPAFRAGMDPQERRRGQPGRPPARGTRTIGMCSFDARNRGSTRPSPIEVGKRDRKEGMDADDLLCSRNARPPKALIGRAQWETKQATLP